MRIKTGDRIVRNGEKIKWEQCNTVVIFIGPPGGVVGLSVNAKNLFGHLLILINLPYCESTYQ